MLISVHSFSRGQVSWVVGVWGVWALDWTLCLQTSPADGLSSSTEGCYRGPDSPLPPIYWPTKSRGIIPPPVEVQEGQTTPQHAHPLPPQPVADVGLSKAWHWPLTTIGFTQDVRLFGAFFSYHLQLFLSFSKVLDLERVNLEGPTDLCCLYPIHSPPPRHASPSKSQLRLVWCLRAGVRVCVC